MNIKNSGKAPDKNRILSALLALSLVFGTGCRPQTASSGNPPPVSETSEISDSSDTSETSSEDTHEPSAPDTPSVPERSSSGSSGTESVSADTESGTAETTSETSEETSETQSSSSPSEEPQPASSSDQSSSSIPEPAPPPEIVIPDVKTPTSPGAQAITGSNGVIDCSNAAQGYISARYTGGSVKAKLRINGNGKEYNHDINVDGYVEYYPLEYGSGSYTVTLFEQIPGSTKYAVAAEGSFDAQLASPLSPFLYPNRYVNFSQSSDAVYKAAELCAGKTASIDKIAAVFVWVADNISYDYDFAAAVTSGYVPDPDRTLSKRAGICFDYASLVAAMLRSQSIPTRLVIGDASPNIYHAWNEVYTEETGWITPELLLKNSGYNLVDATFYSTSPDKVKISEYISDGGNYSALHYR